MPIEPAAVTGGEQPSVATQQRVLDAPASEKPGSMDDTIRNAYRASQQRAAQPAESGEPVDAESQEATQEPRTNSAGRLIDEQGRFIKKDGTVVATEQEADLAEPAKETHAEPVAAKPHDAAPNTWRKEASVDFAKLPENVRQEIHKREQDFHKGVEQYKGWANVGQMLHKEIQPYQEMIKAANTNAPTVIKSLLSMQHKMMTGSPEEKSALLLQIASDNGIDISSLTSAPQQVDQSTVQVDPRLATALQRIDKLESHLTTQERQRAEAEFSSKVDEVTRFGSDPKHEHYETVREDMAALIETGRASDLDDAYNKAIWINPDTRAKLLTKQDQERARKQAEDAAAARKAAGANVTRRGTPPVQATPGKMEDTILNEYRRLNSGG